MAKYDLKGALDRLEEIGNGDGTICREDWPYPVTFSQTGDGRLRDEKGALWSPMYGDLELGDWYVVGDPESDPDLEDEDHGDDAAGVV